MYWPAREAIRTKVFTIVGCEFILFKIKMDYVHGIHFWFLVLYRIHLPEIYLNIGKLKPFQHVLWQQPFGKCFEF